MMPERLQCVGGPCDGSSMSLYPTEEGLDLTAGCYRRWQARWAASCGFIRSGGALFDSLARDVLVWEQGGILAPYRDEDGG